MLSALNPINLFCYHSDFWDKTSSGEKGNAIALAVIGLIGLRIMAGRANVPLPFSPRGFGVYESIGFHSFILYLITSCTAGYVAGKS